MKNNIYCLKPIYHYFEDYVLSFINKISNTEIILYNPVELNICYDKNTNYIFLQRLDENVLNISEFKENKNLFVINTEQTKVRKGILYYPEYVIFLDWSQCNFPYYNNNLTKYWLPYQVNYNEIYNLKKEKDCCMISVNSNYRSYIFNKIKENGIDISNINGWKEYRDITLFKHKILVNISFQDDCSILEQMRTNRCIFNKMIVISNKKDDEKSDFILNKYIIYTHYDDIPKKVQEVIENYDKIYNSIFSNFEEELNNIDYNLDKQLNYIKTILNS
jgi:hypothetical protein